LPRHSHSYAIVFIASSPQPPQPHTVTDGHIAILRGDAMREERVARNICHAHAAAERRRIAAFTLLAPPWLLPID
jgi:hypothetical protein